MKLIQLDRRPTKHSRDLSATSIPAKTSSRLCFRSCMSLRMCGGAAVRHTAQRKRRRTAGGEKEGKQVERTGWRRRRLPGGLAWLDAGRNRRNKGSLRHSPSFFSSLCLLISHFRTTSAVATSFFSFPALLPVHALIISPLHRSLSLFCTLFSVLPACFWTSFDGRRPFMGNEPGRRCAPAKVQMLLAYQERVSNTDSGTVCQGDGTTTIPLPAHVCPNSLRRKTSSNWTETHFETCLWG